MKNYFDPSAENLTKYECGPLRGHVPRIAILLQRGGYTTEHARANGETVSTSRQTHGVPRLALIMPSETCNLPTQIRQ